MHCSYVKYFVTLNSQNFIKNDLQSKFSGILLVENSMFSHDFCTQRLKYRASD